jgi:hypothetical protein
MVQRTVKLIGHAYSTGGDVQVQCTYNGAEVFNSTVEKTVQNPIPVEAVIDNTEIGGWGGKELFIFETTTDITGEIPVSITVTGGTLMFGNFWMNYTGSNRTKEPTNPNVPIDPTDPSTYIYVTTVPPIDYYADPNTNTEASDGILNLKKNGFIWNWRVNAVPPLGDWVYPILDSETVTFDLFVDPAKVVLVAPT